MRAVTSERRRRESRQSPTLPSVSMSLVVFLLARSLDPGVSIASATNKGIPRAATRYSVSVVRQALTFSVKEKRSIKAGRLASISYVMI